MQAWPDPMLDAEHSVEVLRFLTDLTLKGLVLLAAAGLLAVVLRRASAATRHLVWGVALCGMLVLPLLGWIAPAWHVPIFPAPALTRVEHAPAARSENVAAPEARPVGVADDAPVLGTSQERVRRPGQTGVSTFIGAFVVLKDAVSRVHWSTWVVIVWAGGAIAILLQLLVGAGSVWRLSRTARPVHDSAWIELADEIGDRLFLRRPVLLFRSTRTTTPMTWGVLRPVVLLPADADEWTDERRRCVLTHEFAHIQRWDCLTQTLAQAACALYWFNPLVWTALRHLRTEREKACDDYVLNYGARASSYASHLIDIARKVRSPFASPLGAVAMAKPSQLEGRVLAILDADRQRHAPGGRRTASTVAFAAVLLFGLAAMRPWQEPARQSAVATPAPHAVADLQTALEPQPSPTAPVAPAAPAQPEAQEHHDPARVPAPEVAPTPPAPRDKGVGAARPGSNPDAAVLGVRLGELVGSFAGHVGGTVAGSIVAQVGEAIPSMMDGVRLDLNGDGEVDDDEVDAFVRRRIFAIDEGDVEALKTLGFGDVSIDELIEAKVHGVDPAFVKAIRALGYDPDFDELVQLRVLGIEPAYIRELGSVGLHDLSVDDLVQLRTFGIDKRFVLEVRNAGLDEPSVDDLVQLRLVGAVPEED